jgi:hypothetical protein
MISTFGCEAVGSTSLIEGDRLARVERGAVVRTADGHRRRIIPVAAATTVAAAGDEHGVAPVGEVRQRIVLVVAAGRRSIPSRFPVEVGKRRDRKERPSPEVISAIVAMKRRNPGFG